MKHSKLTLREVAFLKELKVLYEKHSIIVDTEYEALVLRDLKDPTYPVAPRVRIESNIRELYPYINSNHPDWNNLDAMLALT